MFPVIFLFLLVKIVEFQIWDGEDNDLPIYLPKMNISALFLDPEIQRQCTTSLFWQSKMKSILKKYTVFSSQNQRQNNTSQIYHT